MREWIERAANHVKQKQPHIAMKLLALTVATAIKYHRAKTIMGNCSKIAFGVSKCLQMELFKK